MQLCLAPLLREEHLPAIEVRWPWQVLRPWSFAMFKWSTFRLILCRMDSFWATTSLNGAFHFFWMIYSEHWRRYLKARRFICRSRRPEDHVWLRWDSARLTISTWATNLVSHSSRCKLLASFRLETLGREDHNSCMYMQPSHYLCSPYSPFFHILSAF